MEEADDKCPECGGEMRMESTAYGDYWTCSNEKCDVACRVDNIGPVFKEEKYFEWIRDVEIECEFNEMFWEDDGKVNTKEEK